MATLTEAVKEHCKITWAGVMSRASDILDDRLGEELVYDDEIMNGRDLQLYLDLCLYLYNGLTVDEFMEANKYLLRVARQHHVDPINTEDTDEDE